MAGGFVRNGGHPYGVVPLALLECRILTLNARLAAAWIIAKPEGWIICPKALQVALGFSEKQWLSARKSLMQAGLFKQSKKKGPDGKWVWNSELDLTPILGTIPPLGMHGEPGDIKIRVKNKGTKGAKGVMVCAHDADKVLSRKSNNLDELKKLHIGHILNDLDIDWYEEGIYVYWDTHIRARRAENGHWLWIQVDGKGEQDARGSAVDLIIDHTGCSMAEAMDRLNRIYQATLRK